MPAADRRVEEILDRSVAGQGPTIGEMPVGVDDRLGTKDAHAEDQKDDLHPSPESLGPGVAVTAPTGKRQRDHHQCNDGRLYHQAMPCLAAIRPAFSSVSINSHT